MDTRPIFLLAALATLTGAVVGSMVLAGDAPALGVTRTATHQVPADGASSSAPLPVEAPRLASPARGDTNGTEHTRTRRIPAAARVARQNAGAGDVLTIASPLLSLAEVADAEPIRVPAARLTGRILDQDEDPVASARVEVALVLEMPDDPRVETVELRDWTTTTDADGHYLLPRAPVGPGATLFVEQDGLRVARIALDAVTTTHHVVRLDGSVAAPIPPARQADKSEGEHALAGRLADADGQPRCGWWIAVVTPAARTEGTPGPRFQLTPVRCDASGEFLIQGVTAGHHRLEAWSPDNSRVCYIDDVAAPDAAKTWCAADATMPERVVGQLRTADGRAVAGVRVGLVRPTGWAVRGWPAMHAASDVVTDAAGRFELVAGSLAALELAVEGRHVLPQRIGLDFAQPRRRLDVTVQMRTWIGPTHPGGDAPAPHLATASPASEPPPTLLAIDARGCMLPVWSDDLLPPRTDQPWTGARPLGFAAEASALLLFREGRELGRVCLRARGQPAAWLALPPREHRPMPSLPPTDPAPPGASDIPAERMDAPSRRS